MFLEITIIVYFSETSTRGCQLTNPKLFRSIKAGMCFIASARTNQSNVKKVYYILNYRKT